MRGALAAALGVALASTPARAEDKATPEWEPPPDPAAVEAGEANLESMAPRKGFIFTFAVGGGFSFGLSMSNATGQGAASTLRLARVANARTVFAIEIVNSQLFFPVSGELYRTDASSFLISGQYYVNVAVWLRGGLGWGRYLGEELRMGDAIFVDRFRLPGPAGSAGAGVDVLRLKRFRASLEFCSTAMINKQGILSSNGILFGLSID